MSVSRIISKPSAFLACGAMFVSGCFAQQSDSSTGDEGHAIKSFLQSYLNSMGLGGDKALRYSYSLVGLSGSEKKEVVVYLVGDDWCGSGGCTAFLLKPEASSFKLINKITLVSLPIRVLPSKTNGWSDLGIPVRGGGEKVGRVAVLSFNGTKYPGNPSVVPKRLSSESTKRDTVIPLKQDGDYLYQ